jgi:hypothetical protein
MVNLELKLFYNLYQTSPEFGKFYAKLCTQPSQLQQIRTSAGQVLAETSNAPKPRSMVYREEEASGTY